MNIQEILLDLRKARDELHFEVSDEIIFDCAVRIFNAQKINNNEKPMNKLATEKQKQTLINMGYPHDVESLTLWEAKHLISEQIKKRSKEGEDYI